MKVRNLLRDSEILSELSTLLSVSKNRLNSDDDFIRHLKWKSEIGKWFDRALIRYDPRVNIHKKRSWSNDNDTDVDWK